MIQTKNNLQHLTQSTDLLDFHHPEIQKLLRERGWARLGEAEKIKSIYNFVRDEIPFGYNETEEIPASRVLWEGYGQCNTKSTLLMALLRAVGIPNRLHGFTIDKALQKGAISGIWYRLAPQNILHTWVEIFFEGEWFFLEGVILDRPFLAAVQKKFPDCAGEFCGFGAFTESFQAPPIEWNRNHTFIQKMGINQDFGLFDTPDEFYAVHRQQMNFIRRFVFRKLARKLINRNVDRIRQGKK